MNEITFGEKLEFVETSFRELFEMKMKFERVDLLDEGVSDSFYCLSQSISSILCELVLDKEVRDGR